MSQRTPRPGFGITTAPMQIDYPDGPPVLLWHEFLGIYHRVGFDLFKEAIYG